MPLPKKLRKNLKDKYQVEDFDVGDIQMVDDPEMMPEPRMRDAVRGAPVVRRAADLGGPMNPGIETWGPEYRPDELADEAALKAANDRLPPPSDQMPPPTDSKLQALLDQSKRPQMGPESRDPKDLPFQKRMALMGQMWPQPNSYEEYKAPPETLSPSNDPNSPDPSVQGPDLALKKMAGLGPDDSWLAALGKKLGFGGQEPAAPTAQAPGIWDQAAAKVAPKPPAKPKALPPKQGQPPPLPTDIEVKEPPNPNEAPPTPPELGPENGPEYRPDELAPPPESAQEQMPDQAKVPNEQLADAVNATSTVTTNNDAQKATEKERAPEDRSAYWAALKGMANASGMNEQGVGYYDAKISEEKQAHKDWQSRLAADLTAKYRNDQMKEKQREFDLKAQENRLKAQENANYREAMLTNKKDAQDAIQSRFNENKIQKVLGEMPSPRTVDAMKRLSKRLENPREIQGWDTAKTFDKAGRVSGVLQPTGIPFQVFANEWRKGTEAEGMMQDVMAVFQGIQLETSGKVINQQEMENIEKRLGMAAGQSQAAFRNAMRNELSGISQRVDLYYRAQSPDVQEEIKKRGILPDLSPAQSTGYAPEVKWRAPGSPEAGSSPGGGQQPSGQGYGADALYNSLKKRFSVDESVSKAKDNEDEEKRRQARRTAGFTDVD